MWHPTHDSTDNTYIYIMLTMYSTTHKYTLDTSLVGQLINTLYILVIQDIVYCCSLAAKIYFLRSFQGHLAYIWEEEHTLLQANNAYNNVDNMFRRIFCVS